MSEARPPLNAAAVAREVAEQLQSRGQEYALGGAIALGYWGEPRGTVDVDITLFLPPERPSECVWQLAGMYGTRDPRLSAWDELVREIPVEDVS